MNKRFTHHFPQILRFTTAACLFSSLVLPALSQNTAGDRQPDPKKRQMEFLEDTYVSSPREAHATSPAYRFDTPDFSVVQVNVDIQGNNILDDAANEPSIVFNPNTPDFLAIGWRQFDDINNNFRQAGYGWSDDAGATWFFPGNIDQGVFRSDPVLRCDADGNFYYNSLTVLGNDYFCNVYKSVDGGSTWEMGTFAQGGDKQWMSIDRTQGVGKGNIYAHWTSSYSICSPGFFTRSTDGNLSYEDCISIPGDPYWGTTFVSDNGDLYITGAQWSGFRVVRSANAENPEQEIEWDLSSSVNLDGEIIGFGGYSCPNPVGLLGQTQISMDTSGGTYDGYLYVLCSVDRNSISDPCDVMFARSTNGGLSWESPKRINDDLSTTNYQWFGTMSVAPDGRIDVIWLDTRDNPGQVISALYYSYSLDGGDTWTPNEKLSESFNPHLGWPQQEKMGDYFDMFSTAESAHLAWTATFNLEQDVYYSVITPHYVGIADLQDENIQTACYPNPFRAETEIRYDLRHAGHVSLNIYSSNGQQVASLVNEIQPAGFHQVNFDGSSLEGGIYYYRIQTAEGTKTGKVVKIN